MKVWQGQLVLLEYFGYWLCPIGHKDFRYHTKLSCPKNLKKLDDLLFIEYDKNENIFHSDDVYLPFMGGWRHIHPAVDFEELKMSDTKE